MHVHICLAPQQLASLDSGAGIFRPAIELLTVLTAGVEMDTLT